MNGEERADSAKRLVAGDKGLLATDERTPAEAVARAIQQPRIVTQSQVEPGRTAR